MHCGLARVHRGLARMYLSGSRGCTLVSYVTRYIILNTFLVGKWWRTLMGQLVNWEYCFGFDSLKQFSGACVAWTVAVHMAQAHFVLWPRACVSRFCA